MNLDEWRHAGALFEWHGQRIFYRDQGQGEVLLCLHGFPTASWDWHRLWPALTATRRVIALDFLGYGFSSKPEHHTYSAAEQADIVLALMQALGVRQAHVLAHDFGDRVAQEL